MSRKYYSQRNDETATAISTRDFGYRFFSTYYKFARGHYFSRLEFLGTISNSKLKNELGMRFGIKGVKMFPTADNLSKMDLSSIFDLIEFLSEYVSDPDKTPRHYSNGEPYISKKGENKWRKIINVHLALLDPPYNLTENLEVEVLPSPVGLQHLVNSRSNSHDIQEKVDHACKLFLNRKATIHDKRDALKNLVDTLEPLRDDLESRIGKKDAGKLFDIANNYGIRHNNKNQMELDENYMSWFFYCALATINLMTNLSKSSK